MATNSSDRLATTERPTAGRPTAERHRRRSGRRAALAAASLAVLGLAASCTPGTPTSTNALAGQLTTRSVDVSVSGATSYSVDDAPAVASGGPAGFTVAYNGSSLVTDVRGTLGYDAGEGNGPTLALDLVTTITGTAGTVTVTDAADGIGVSVYGFVNGFVVDDLGNVSGSVSDGARTVTFSTASVTVAPGADPALEALVGEQATFCQDAQQRLAGLDESEVPLASITNTREASRAVFAGSKSVVSPLTVRTWTDTTDVTSTSGDHLTIAQRISCKTRAADHVATTGVSTAASDAPCSTLNQRSIDLALEQLTPSQQAAVTLPTLGADVVRETGAEWTTPLAGEIEFGGNVLRAHSLLTRWNDPTFSIFPDTIRGVHYCTTWTPAYAYTYLLGTISAD